MYYYHTSNLQCAEEYIYSSLHYKMVVW